MPPTSLAGLAALLPSWPALGMTLFASLLAGLARGFSGFGSALIFMPLASAALGPQMAGPVLAVADNLAAVPMLRAAWERAGRREVAVMVAGALVGTPFGVWLLLHVNPEAMRWAISLVAFAMLALLISGWRYHGQPHAGLTGIVGMISGVFSGAVQLGGPPVIVYWLGGAIPAAQVRANIVLFFAGSGLISVAAFLIGGLLGWGALLVGLLVLPVYLIGVFAGMRLFGVASELSFRRACYALIAVAAVLGMPLWDHFR